MIKLSIIVPVYNVEKYIKKCLESLIIQPLEDIEIILIDDGSEDASGKICDEYSKRDTRIKVVHKKNEGVSIARNTGMQMAQGKYITFVDSDDWIENNTYEILLKKLEQQEVDLLIYNYNYINNQTEKNICFPESIFIKNDKEKIQDLQALTLAPELGKYTSFQVTFLGLGVCWNKIYKKEIIEKNNLQFKIKRKNTMNEDLLFNYEYLENVNAVQIVNENLYNYRQISTSAVKKFNHDILNIYQELLGEIQKHEEKHIQDVYYKTAFNLRVTLSFFYIVKLYFCHKENKKPYFTRYKEFKKCLKEEKYNQAFKNIDKKYCNYKVKITKILLHLKMYLLLFILLGIFSKSKN